MSAAKMRPIRETISLVDALRIVEGATPPLKRTEHVPLHEAGERILACTMNSDTHVPPFDRAAMDGYAVVAEDTFGANRQRPRSLECVEKVYTGTIPTRSIERGQCVEIATGAPMPEGADAGVMVEETAKAEDNNIAIMIPVYPHQNVGQRGADITPGQTLVKDGEQLTASRIGALAAIGVSRVEVYKRPRVALLSTGDEIIEPGQVLAPGQIYDINRFTLETLVRSHGGVAIHHPPTADTLDALTATINSCLTHDLLVFSGGSSVGAHDLIVDVLRQHGEILFHGIAVKPGKPTVFGRIGTMPVLGMPGYPTSCLSNAYMLLIPMLRRIGRLPLYHPRTLTLPLAERIVSTTGRHQFYTVRVTDGMAMPAFKASGDITSMSLADGYVEIPAQTDIVEKGEVVDVKLF